MTNLICWQEGYSALKIKSISVEKAHLSISLKYVLIDFFSLFFRVKGTFDLGGISMPFFLC